MKTVTLIRKINAVGAKHYHHDNAVYEHELYLKECEEILFEYLNSQLGENLLFTTLSLKDRRKDKVVFANPEIKYRYANTTETIFQPIIEGADGILNDIQVNEQCLSITLSLLEQSNGYDLVFEGKEKYKDDIKGDDAKIHFFDLTKLIPDDDFETFLTISENDSGINIFEKLQSFKNADKRKIGRLLWYYNRMRTEYLKAGSDFHVHFIRPAFIDFDHNLLLSLATNKPIDESILSTINLIIYKIVSLMATEREKQSRIVDMIQTTYSLGHNLKNRLLDSDRLMRGLSKDIESVSLDELEKSRLSKWTTGVSVKLKSLSNTGNLLDLIGRSMNLKGDDTVFKEKQDWHSNEVLCIRSFLIDFYTKSFFAVSTSGKYAKIDMPCLSRDLKIEPWLLFDNKKIRPSDFIYEEIFFELFVNALSYGNSYANGNYNLVDVEVIQNEAVIVISNTPGIHISQNAKFKNLTKNFEIDVKQVGHGGLLYISNFLSQTQIGSIKVILDDVNNLFKIILTLKGLKTEML